MSATALWWIALGAGLVVTAVVALLLWLVLDTARDIRDVLAEIWVAGPKVASNTVHLDLLRRIHHQLRPLPGVAERIEDAAGRLQEHAAGCPGCPMCVTGWQQRRQGGQP